ncbi:MAG: serine hydrolase domain-containing protein [Sphingomonas sp.]
MRILRAMILGLAAVALPVAAQTLQEKQPARPLAPPTASGTPNTAPGSTTAPVLTGADVDAWLDGFVPYALHAGDIPGAVVVVVKDGQVLTQRGYGLADVKAGKKVDPAATLFRPGSISKLFTWTAVMQQVQAGKLNLDADVNQYIDFKIPPFEGKPITLRNLMTHTGGFEETAKHLLTYDQSQVKPLDVALKRWVPTRIYAPGSMPAYSNYGASLAGYIVQRVSGEPFDVYIQRHIFAPLGMAHSSFSQPLAPALAAAMSKGYPTASQDPKPFEYIDLAPAGSLSTTGADMAKFMLAHLANGGPLLNPQTAQLMHSAANTPVPGLPSMALGFYHEDRNNRVIIGHGGDTDLFHSDLHLYLNDGVGLFISLNSPGKDGAAHPLRERIFKDFTDRYFPYAQPNLPTAATAKEHGQAMVGHYASSRGSETNFMKFVGLLGETAITLNDDNTISVSALQTPGGVPKRWREVGPWQWMEVGGTDRLHAVAKDGKVAYFATADLAPIMEFVPVSGTMDAGWVLPFASIALIIALITALSWPVVALVRRNYGQPSPVAGRALWLHRASRVTAWILPIVAFGWVMVLSAISSDVSALDGRMDIWMRLLQLLAVVAIVGALLSVWNAYVTATAERKRWFVIVWSVLFAASALFLAWLAIDLKLITASLNY